MLPVDFKSHIPSPMTGLLYGSSVNLSSLTILSAASSQIHSINISK